MGDTKGREGRRGLMGGGRERIDGREGDNEREERRGLIGGRREEGGNVG